MSDAATEPGTTLLQVVMPKLSDAMEEGTVVAWLKRPGDTVKRGEPFVEVETDKATVVYEAEATGVLDEIIAEEGSAVPRGGAIARLRVTSVTGRPEPAVSEQSNGRSARPIATPVARRLARELRVDLSKLTGTGPGGRVIAVDVRAAGSRQLSPSDVTAGSVAQPSERGASNPVEFTQTQRTIAKRMEESRRTIPDFAVEAEINVDAVQRWREEVRAAGRTPVPTLTDVIVRAAAVALREFPNVNATWADGAPVRHSRVNVGVAVAAQDTLLVPTIYDADERSVFEVAAEVRRLAAAVRDGTIAPHEVANATFTVSNLGMFGVRRFSAIINPPQVAILSVGEVVTRPAFENGAVVPRSVMDVTLTCDHRAVYGEGAARFLGRIRELFELGPWYLVDGWRPGNA